MASYDVVIIGSGLVGASTANALMRAGAGRVLLLDRGNAGGGDSALTFGDVVEHCLLPSVRCGVQDLLDEQDRVVSVSGCEGHERIVGNLLVQLFGSVVHQLLCVRVEFLGFFWC
jgi:saccharopine dehydrogenase-like NADP-dependent oxidoreductase